MLAQLGLLALSALPSAVAWGTIASQATAIVAQHFMTAATVKAVKQMLGDSSATYLQTAATYGASYSTSKAGSWSYNDFYMCKLYMYTMAKRDRSNLADIRRRAC